MTRATTDVEEFLAATPAATRLLGIDLGAKTLGLAVSDAGRSLVSPLTTLKRGKFSADAEQLAALCRIHQIGGVVLGLPLNMDGSAGPRAQAARAYGVNLTRALALPVLLSDERLSSFAAEETMIEAGVNRVDRAAKIDAAAAAIILQDSLDRIARR